MRWRLAGLVVLVAVLAAGAFVGWPFLQGYLGARQQNVPPAPVQQLDKQPPAPSVSTIKENKQQATKPTEQPVQPPPQSQTKPSPPPVPANGAPVGESKIDKEYLAQLEEIGQYYQDQLNALESQAYQSYLAVKEGKSNASLMSLAGQYIREGDNMEEQSDNQFFGVWKQYQEALAKAGLPTTYLDQARTEYINAKAAERQKILSAAKQYLK